MTLLMLALMAACGAPRETRFTPTTCEEAQANINIRQKSIQQDLDSRTLLDPLGMVISDLSLPDEIAALNIVVQIRDDLCFKRRQNFMPTPQH